MDVTENKPAVFISYAWGGGLEKKEWLRRSIVASLDWKYTVFWDRDSIGYGDSVDLCISKALSKRPISVLCLCDADYAKASQLPGSGLHRELKLLAEMAFDEGVKIIPLILEPGCADQLPEPLAGRVYLNLERMHSRGLHLGDVVLALADGATQAQVGAYLEYRLKHADLRKAATTFLRDVPVRILGNAFTHEVTVRPGQLLTAPPWMWSSKDWDYMLSDDSPHFCPTKGRWPWDYPFSASRGMCALGAAVMSAFFSHRNSPADIDALEVGGRLLAIHVFAMTRHSEPFILDAEDLIQTLINDEEGFAALEHLVTPQKLETAPDPALTDIS